jgi:hypothetical protein
MEGAPLGKAPREKRFETRLLRLLKIRKAWRMLEF